MTRRAFTLVELLTVMAILSILASISTPLVKTVKGAAFTHNAGQAMRQLGQANSMYMTDYDDTFPLAFYSDGWAFQTWFGWRDANGPFAEGTGLLASYIGDGRLKDPIHDARDYLGDQSGFGYNYGFLGSDMGYRDFQGWPMCQNPARLSELSQPSDTVAYATSSYYHPTWVPGGDGVTYDFGFIDAPAYWGGNPNIDFRHQGKREVDVDRKVVTGKGTAVIVFADGRVKNQSERQLSDAMFWRQSPDS